MPKVQDLMFNSPEGKLEGRFLSSEKKNAPAALCLHPHPLHGGTMNNKVVYNAFHALGGELGFSVMRFNFRGCGKSQGTFNNGVGELADAACALDVLQDMAQEASSYWLVGFSFGSWIQMQLLMRRPEIAGFIAIAPPAQSYDFSFLSPCPAQGLIIHGTADQIVPEKAVFSLYEKLNKQKHASVEYSAINGADHFFKDNMEDLKSSIISYVKPRVSMEPIPVKLKRDRRRRQAHGNSNTD